MANQKISALNSLTRTTVATVDVLPIVDTSGSETKKITYQELIQPQDDKFRIAGSSDTTKLVAFEVDGLTSATTRTITVPDADLTLVGLTTTQTLTNKTLTSPQINFGSDATGDLLYRTSGGVTARLPIGSTDQILAVQAGIPAWIANPSASAASQTAAGIIEIATTAEQTTGTDDTRAATPKSVHDMTSLAGAAWFLDEDTMSSDSATKTASQQSIKAYVDSRATPKVGNFNMDMSTTTTTTIAHGLGRAPVEFEISWFAGYGASAPVVTGHGVYNGTTQVSSYIIYNTNGGTNTGGQANKLVHYSYGGTSLDANYNEGTASFDATNLTITWAKTSSPTGTAYFIWKAR